MEIVRLDKEESYKNIPSEWNDTTKKLSHKFSSAAERIDLWLTDYEEDLQEIFTEVILVHQQDVIYMGETIKMPKKYQNMFFNSFLLTEGELPTFTVLGLKHFLDDE